MGRRPSPLISQALGCRRGEAAVIRHEGIDGKAQFVDGSVAWRRGLAAPVVLLPLSRALAVEHCCELFTVVNPVMLLPLRLCLAPALWVVKPRNSWLSAKIMFLWL